MKLLIIFLGLSTFSFSQNIYQRNADTVLQDLNSPSIGIVQADKPLNCADTKSGQACVADPYVSVPTIALLTDCEKKELKDAEVALELVKSKIINSHINNGNEIIIPDGQGCISYSYYVGKLIDDQYIVIDLKYEHSCSFIFGNSIHVEK